MSSALVSGYSQRDITGIVRTYTGSGPLPPSPARQGYALRVIPIHRDSPDRIPSISRSIRSRPVPASADTNTVRA